MPEAESTLDFCSRPRATSPGYLIAIYLEDRMAISITYVFFLIL